MDLVANTRKENKRLFWWLRKILLAYYGFQVEIPIGFLSYVVRQINQF